MIIFTTLGSIERIQTLAESRQNNSYIGLVNSSKNIHLTYSLYNLEDSIDNLGLDFKKCNPRRYG